MNFLQICQRLRQECGIPGTGPTTVVNQTGELRKLVDWAASAWKDIQNLKDEWKFLRSEFSFNMAIGTGEYTPATIGATNFKKWITERPSITTYETAVGVADEQWIVEWDYDVFKETYRYASQTPGRPMVFAQRPWDDALMFGPVADKVYTCKGEYQKTAALLAADADTPAINSDYHEIIVWRALLFYGMHIAAPDALVKAETGYNDLMAAMERKYLPSMQFGAPTA